MEQLDLNLGEKSQSRILQSISDRLGIYISYFINNLNRSGQIPRLRSKLAINPLKENSLYLKNCITDL